MRDYAASSLARLKDARDIADSLRHDPPKHRAAMNAVFALEDCYEAFLLLSEEHERLMGKSELTAPR